MYFVHRYRNKKVLNTNTNILKKQFLLIEKKPVLLVPIFLKKFLHSLYKQFNHRYYILTKICSIRFKIISLSIRFIIAYYFTQSY